VGVILTTLRIMESNDFSQGQQCPDADFDRALSMIRVLARHSSHVSFPLPAIRSARPKDRKAQFLELLTLSFTRSV
jgi:hypothetical protein